MLSKSRATTRYSIALLFTAAAFAVRWGMGPMANRPMLVLFCIAILFSAIVGGLGPGLLATFLSAAAASYLLLHPAYTVRPPDTVDLAHWLLLCLFGLLASVMAGALRSLQRSSGEQLHFQSQILAHVRDAVVAIDREKRIIFWGPGAETLCGIPAREALGKRDSELYEARWLSPGGPAEYAASLAERGTFRGENILVLPSGRQIHVESTVAVLRNPDGRECGRMAVMRDISDRKRAEREATANEARLHLALADLDMALFNQDRDLRYTWVYRPQLAAPNEVIGKTDFDMLEKLRLPDMEKVIAAKRRVLETGVGLRIEIRIGAGADARWYDLAVEPIRDDSGSVVGITSASLNVTEPRRAEERLRESRRELRALAGRLHSIREKEQTRIARDLHDELGQLLTALKMHLRSLETKIGSIDPDNTQGVLDRAVAASDLVDETLTTVRRIALELRPGALDRLGLVPALRQEIRRFHERTGIPCEATFPEQLPELRPELATALYRIWQEAMTNVHRHAGASRVAVRLDVVSDRLKLEVEDDGRGFDLATVANPHALGLLGMVERAEALEGEVDFRRGEGRGTVVTASIPLVPRQATSHRPGRI